MQLRLDKFLKVSRLVKRRTVAKEMSDKGRILVNGLVAKAGTNIEIDDELAIQFGQKLVTVKVNAIKETVKKEEADSMYTVVSEKRIEN